MDDQTELNAKLSLYQQLSGTRRQIEGLTAEEVRVSKRIAEGADGADLTLAQIKSDVEALYQQRDHLISVISNSDSLERGRSIERRFPESPPRITS